MSNPLLKDSVFESAERQLSTMTISGTINKSILLWLLLAASAFFSWTHPGIIGPYVFAFLIGGLVLSMVTIFQKQLSPILSPLYALCEGFVLGVFSLYFEKSYPGIVVNAILLTVCVLFCMLAAYKSGVIRATPTFKKVIILSTLAIFAVYIIDMLLNLFGAGNFPYIHQSSGIGILISCAIVLIASFNLILDFDLIEQAEQFRSPKFMEWYCAFSLMITLVWLYIEMLRLLSKMRD
ncbi:MAG: Bax inhibitor-1/YccA family protein [Elusimicrobiota bacterium]|jgi:uncharacterized YccA/Bax inhibitor family protein|nr:Bax inhibitor-1/YccA family protein [Elusimicrobiota bacterium]